MAGGPAAALHPGSLMEAGIDPFGVCHWDIVPLLSILVGWGI
jgi:hypothetical protein